MFSCLFVVILYDPIVLILIVCTRDDAARGKRMEGVPGEARVWAWQHDAACFIVSDKTQWMGRPMLQTHQIPLQLPPQVKVSEAQKTWRSFLRHQTGEIQINEIMSNAIYLGPEHSWLVSTIVDRLGNTFFLGLQIQSIPCCRSDKRSRDTPRLDQTWVFGVDCSWEMGQPRTTRSLQQDLRKEPRRTRIRKLADACVWSTSGEKGIATLDK